MEIFAEFAPAGTPGRASDDQSGGGGADRLEGTKKVCVWGSRFQRVEFECDCLQ